MNTTTRSLAVLLVLAMSALLVASDDIVFFSENGHYYQLLKLDKAVTNDEAKSIASAKSHNKQTGYIVTIGTLSEQTFLSSYLTQLNVIPVGDSDYPTIWAGGYRTSATSWVWNAAGRISNPFFDVSKLQCSGYCNWNDTTAVGFPANKTCVQIYLSNTNGPTPGTWRPASCANVSQALVVEYDASTTCTAGYVYRTSKGWCEDVNECTNNPKICSAGFKCVNTIGSYYCDDINECVNTTICNAGLQCSNTNGSYVCVDINECLQVPSVCMDGYECQNKFATYQCNDINECSLNSSLCRKGYLCQNTPGSYVCNDINECDQSPCSFGTKCSNTIGSYTCDSIYYYIQSDYNPNVVLDFKLVNGVNRLITRLKINNLNATNQLWSITPEGFVVNTANGQVIDAEGGLVYPGVKAILWPRKTIDQAGNQLWEYDSLRKYWLSSKDNIVLDIFNGQYGAGAELCLFTAKDANSDSLNQQWTLIETSFQAN